MIFEHHGFIFVIHNVRLIPCCLKTHIKPKVSEMEDALSTVKGAYWEINYQTKEEYVSEWFIKSLGYTDGFTKISDFKRIIHKEDEQKLNKAWKAFAKAQYTSEFDCTFKYITKRGTFVETWARGKVAEFDKAGIPIKFVGIQLNVSKIRRINKDLQRITRIIYKQSKEIKDFATITSHNLRSPMSNLVTLVDFYIKSDNDAEKLEIFNMIRKASARLSGIIDDLGGILSISAVPESQQEIIDFTECLQKVQSMLIADITGYDVEFSHSFKVQNIMYSRTYIESIFLNLITNSIRYREKGRGIKIKIATWQQDGKVWMTFEDNGSGIDLNRYGQRMFGYGKTFHVHNEAKGIGLFITKTQIESMGGHIEVESKVGEWTKFIICFYA